MTRRIGPRYCQECQERLKREEILYNDRRCNKCVAAALERAAEEQAEAEKHTHPNWRRIRDRDSFDPP